MTNPYGISAIGMNPLGTIGLDYNSAYASYNSPMMAGMMMPGMMPGMMTSGYQTLNPMGMGMGMMGMYNPAFMQQYMSAQQEIEKQQVQHSSNMHQALMQAEVDSLKAHDKATFSKIAVDGDIQRGIANLATAVRKGDSDAIIMEYDKVKANILLKYANELKADKDSDTNLRADRYIEMMYSQIVSQQTGETVSLRSDIKKYGESAFENGFYSTFLGNDGHNKKYSEEVLSYIDGNTRINDKGSKEKAKTWGKIGASVTEGAGATVAGAVTAVGVLGIAKALPKIGSKVQFLKWAKPAAWIGAGVLLAGDILWQLTRSDNE